MRGRSSWRRTRRCRCRRGSRSRRDRRSGSSGRWRRGRAGRCRPPGTRERPEKLMPTMPTCVLRHPGLMGHDLDGVVGVVVGRITEEVEGAARAARPPHLEADGGEPGDPGERRIPPRWRVSGNRFGSPQLQHGVCRAWAISVGIGSVGRGDVVTRVLDDRGTGGGGTSRSPRRDSARWRPAGCRPAW